MEEIYILNVLQYLLGYFEIYMCFEILRKVYKKENTKIKQCFEILICISLAVIEAIKYTVNYPYYSNFKPPFPAARF